MLEYKWIKTSQDKKTFFKNFDIKEGLWIAPYFQAQRGLEDFYMRSQKSLIGNPFKTSSEFWKERWLYEHPEIPVISEKSIQVFIKSQLHLREEKWFPGSSLIIFKLLSHFLPLLSHIEGPELLASLLQNNPSLQKKWGLYLLESLKIWKEIREKFIHLSWIPSLLSSHFSLNKKVIIVDMSCHLHLDQMCFFQQLAEKNNIIILAPDLPWISKYSDELKAYHLQNKASTNRASKDPSHFLDKSQNVVSRRFVSMLAEVKDATSTVRKWIEQGIKPHHIAISAPSIDFYWPVLKPYLTLEGIPYNTSSVTKLYSIPQIARWLSQIQVQLKPQVQPHALELATFGRSECCISYTQFHRIYSSILDLSDYKRSPTIYDRFVKIKKEGISKTEPINVHFFLEYILTLWPDKSSNESIEGLTTILKNFIKDTKGLHLLKISYWLEILEHTISQSSLPLQESSAFGIYISDIAHLEYLFVEHIYMMGLSEEGLQSRLRSSILTNADIDLIHEQLGFSLEPTEKAPLEFSVDWILTDPHIHKVISYPESDFMAEVLSPSLLWLKNQKQVTSPHEPSTTLWDTYQDLASQSDYPENLLHFQDKKTILNNIHNEIKEQHREDLLPYRPAYLSVSSLERYYKCPFIFYAEDVLKLSSRPALEMDMDALDHGSLIHALLAHLTEEPFRSEWTKQQLSDLIESCLVREKISFAEGQFKDYFKEKQIKKLQEFLQFEKKWRERFPNTKTLLKEASLSAYIDPQTGQLSSTEREGWVLIKGRLDRLDQVEKDILCLIDYKTSLANRTNYKTWLKKGEFQLGLYALMIQEDHLNGISGEIASAVYFGIKEMKRNKGFLLQDYNEQAYVIENHYHKINKNGRDQFFKELKKEITKIVSSIIKGDFPAQPKDFKSCYTCHWRNICNAPHLK